MMQAKQSFAHLTRCILLDNTHTHTHQFNSVLQTGNDIEESGSNLDLVIAPVRQISLVFCLSWFSLNTLVASRRSYRWWGRHLRVLQPISSVYCYPFEKATSSAYSAAEDLPFHWGLILKGLHPLLSWSTDVAIYRNSWSWSYPSTTFQS